jgi:hypothetical protein
MDNFAFTCKRQMLEAAKKDKELPINKQSNEQINYARYD